MKKMLLKVFAVLTFALSVGILSTGNVYASEEEPEKYVYREVTRDYDFAREVLDIVNEERTAQGLEPLYLDYYMTETAMQRAVETTFEFSHTRLTGQSCFSMLPDHVKGARGENIAAGQRSPAAVMASWLNSSGHRANILNEDYKYIGIGCVRYSGMYGVYWVQMFSSDTEYAEELRTGQSFEGGYYAYKESHAGDLGGVDYSAVFDSEYYLNNNSDIKELCGNDTGKAFTHFMHFGMREARKGNAKFDVNIYRSNYSDLNFEFGGDLKQYYEHYVNYGKAEGRVCTMAFNRLYYAAVFDVNYYADHNTDIREVYGYDDVSLYMHFINYGIKEGRVANAEFNVNIYRENYPDLQNAFGDNIAEYYEHYINYGKAEGRIADFNINSADSYAPIFEAEYYAANNSDVANAFGKDKAALLKHFIEFGMREGRSASSSFNVNVYRACNADLQAAFGDNLQAYYEHYINYGIAEGRKAI